MAAITVRLRYLRQAPRKIRRLIGVIRGRSATSALEQLAATKLASVGPVTKLLKSGLAAARDHQLDVDRLVIQRAVCDGGPALKRRLINSRGRASQMKKYLSHITLTLAEQQSSPRRPARTGRNHGSKD